MTRSLQVGSSRAFKLAYELFSEMGSGSNGSSRDEGTYGAILSCCKRSGDWVLALEIWERLKSSSRGYGRREGRGDGGGGGAREGRGRAAGAGAIRPNLQMYTSIINALGTLELQSV